MKQETDKIRYFLYARKSSEDEDRQVQSVPDQIKDLQRVINNLGLNVKKIYREEKSAKKPNNRPIFDEMLERIESGEAEGILCWQVHRLSRNPVDSGKLSWLLQNGVIQSIRTLDREYLPDDNVIVFNVDAGSANQFIIDLRKGTRRGMVSRFEKGWRPCLAPQGYLNDKEEKTIVDDPERFHLVRKMWDLMLTGNYTPPKILKIATEEWGYRTRKFKKIGGGELTKSGIYSIFTNPFYAGIIKFKGDKWEEYEGNHTKMITLEEFDQVQMILGRKGKPRPQTHEFAFTGSIRCKECGCLYTAQEKKKIAKKSGKITKYTYYNCTRRTKRVNCTQRKSIRKEEIERQIEKEIEKLTIFPEFLHWALKDINNRNDKEIEDRSKIYEMQHKSLTIAQGELDELTKMRYRKLIDDEAFLKEKKELQDKITRLKEQLRQTEDRAERWIELTEKTFTFATYARQAFLVGGLEKKKEILMGLGYKITMLDGVLKIEPNDWFARIEREYPQLEAEYKRLELNKVGASTGLNGKQKEALASIRSRWYPWQDSNLQPLP